MSRHVGEPERPIIGARATTGWDKRVGDWDTDDIATLTVERNRVTGNVEIWADQIDVRTGVTGQTLLNIRLTKADALALAEALYEEAHRG